MGNDYMEAIRKLVDDDTKNDVEKEMIMAVDELQAARRQAIRKLIEDDIRNDVEEEMRKAADELLAARRQAIREVLEEQRQAIKQVVEEQRQVVWAGLEDLRDSISNYSLNKIGEVDDSNAGTELEVGSIVIHNSK